MHENSTRGWGAHNQPEGENETPDAADVAALTSRRGTRVRVPLTSPMPAAMKIQPYTAHWRFLHKYFP